MRVCVGEPHVGGEAVPVGHGLRPSEPQRSEDTVYGYGHPVSKHEQVNTSKERFEEQELSNCKEE